jgi:hypothetical protein
MLGGRVLDVITNRIERVEAISENVGVCSVVFCKIQCGEYDYQYNFEYVLVACESICKFIIMCWLLPMVNVVSGAKNSLYLEFDEVRVEESWRDQYEFVGVLLQLTQL